MKTAKLFMNGRTQAARLPKALRFEGKLLFIKKIGDAVMLLPYSDEPWQPLLDSLEQFTDDFMVERAQP